MRKSLVALAAVCGLLAGCGSQTRAVGPEPRASGRYGGIGVVEAGPVWQHMADAPKPADKAQATIADDAHVIVTVDSHTGEVRQCGDHSGYCVATNPWSGAAGQGLPVKLEKHAEDMVTNAVEVSNVAVESDEATDERPAKKR